MELKILAVFFLLTSLTFTIHANPAGPVSNMPGPKAAPVPEAGQGKFVIRTCCTATECAEDDCPPPGICC